ncbi:hypothetical protein JNJ66_00085 [Candidatus Saccharibacteria bacterium]|nr:hypothetical protein [Candidatus Saccharibacteria bacterium]
MMSDGLDAFSVVTIVMFVIFLLAMEILRRWLWSRVFRQLGERAWKAWVPVVDLCTVFKLGYMSPYLGVATYAAIAALLLAGILGYDGLGLVMALFFVVLGLAICSLIAIFRIGKRAGLPWAIFLVYFFAGEIIWLLALVVARYYALKEQAGQQQ